ncbi:universal stress protein UspD, partial [Salmonella enterica]|nr:universal stress protein UspD [Salmonella enterica]
MSYKHIAVAISGNDEDKILIRKALGIVRPNDATLTLIHIDDELSSLYSGVYIPFSEEVIHNLKDISDHKIIKLANSIEWPKTKLRIEKGIIPETLLEVIQDEGCDIFICGHHHSFINRLMPSYRKIINKISADL